MILIILAALGGVIFWRSRSSKVDHNSVNAEWTGTVAPESAEAIKKAIVEVTHTTPNDADVNRVRSRLAAGGWPLARPEHTD